MCHRVLSDLGFTEILLTIQTSRSQPTCVTRWFVVFTRLELTLEWQYSNNSWLVFSVSFEQHHDCIQVSNHTNGTIPLRHLCEHNYTQTRLLNFSDTAHGNNLTNECFVWHKSLYLVTEPQNWKGLVPWLSCMPTQTFALSTRMCLKT